MPPRFPITDAALREMNRIERMKLKNARDVVRKGSTAAPSGEYVPPDGGGGGTSNDRGQFNALTFTGEETGQGHESEVNEAYESGFYHWPALDRATQSPRVDLSICEEMRLVVHNHSPVSPLYRLYPIYNPEASWDDVADQTDGWSLTNGDAVPSLGLNQGLWTLPEAEPYIPLSSNGSLYTDWVTIPAGMKQDVFLSFAITAVTGVPFRIGYAQLQVRWGFSSSSSESPTFTVDAPGYLTEEDGEFFGDWCVAETHEGYTKAQAKGLVSHYLNNAQGWEQAGITFRYTEEAPAVIYKVVTEATCDSPELACTHWNYEGNGYNLVELEYGPMNGSFGSGIGAGNLVNHETGHAFFAANHTGTGVMADFDNNRPVWPNAADIQAVIDWLAS